MPKVGETYRKNGFDFRVDHVSVIEVYVARWPVGEFGPEHGRLMRVPLEAWAEEMADAEMVKDT